MSKGLFRQSSLCYVSLSLGLETFSCRLRKSWRDLWVFLCVCCVAIGSEVPASALLRFLSLLPIHHSFLPLQVLRDERKDGKN